MNKKTFTFVITEQLNKPVGGYKVVFEYCNYLASKGNAINLIYDYEFALKRHNKLPTFVKKIFYFMKYKGKISWFFFHKNVQTKRVWKVVDKTIPDSDFVFATALETSFVVQKLSSCKGVKCYFIQGYENWNCTDEHVLSSYNLGLNNFAVSTWLQKIVENASNKHCFLLPNGIDLDSFACRTEYMNRKKHSISLMYSISPNKGFIYGFECVKKLKALYPDLTVDMFGIEPWHNEGYDWIDYHLCASETELCDIFNKNRVYICSSLEEGFGLTGIESMACGSVLVSTNTKGVLEYAKHNYNSLLCPSGDVDALIANSINALENDILACNLSKNGQETVNSKFNIINSYKMLDSFIDSLEALKHD